MSFHVFDYSTRVECLVHENIVFERFIALFILTYAVFNLLLYRSLLSIILFNIYHRFNASIIDMWCSLVSYK